jgi:iron(III) transport system ATP-binding protein
MIVTHDPEEAMFLADRIALMRSGRLVQVGAPADLYLRPADAFAAAFFGEVNKLSGVVRGGCVDTPLGAVRGLGFADGQPVQVLIRPEALSLSLPPAETGATVARVEAARLLGRTSLVHLELDDGEGSTLHLHSRVPGRFLPSEGSELFVSFDPAQAFVFAQTGPH